MRLKKILMVSVLGATLMQSSPCFAMANCLLFGACSFQDAIGAAVSLAAREWNRHTEKIHYDITDGLRQVKEAIGNYQDEGICGQSATGASGCDLATEEEGAAMAEAAANAAAVIPESTIAIILHDESKGEITYNANVQGSLADQGSTFDQVRENVESYMFATDDPNVNADCVCASGTGNDCAATECAQQRQNDALVTSSTGAASVADTYLRDIEKNYNNLNKLVKEVNTAETIVDMIVQLGNISVYASSAAVEQMLLQAYDLRVQSYRNLISSGSTLVNLASLTEGDKE